MLKRVHPAVLERSTLGDLTREYSFYEICIITRSGPAKILGLKNKGHLGPGADADITIYTPDDDKTKMFEMPRTVIKSGVVIVDQGEIREPLTGKLLYVAPDYDAAIETDIAEWFEKYYSIRFRNYPVSLDYLHDPEEVACADSPERLMLIASATTGNTSVPVEVEGLTPSAVRGLSLAEIERFEIFHGNRKVPLAEFFNVSGDPTDARFEFEGNLAGVHWIGAQMSEGEIHIQGDAGRHVGSEMTGGVIHVHGNASDWVGGEMQGGLIHVHGNAGHLVGSAYRGSKIGMTGGTILIDGSAGNEVGLTLRRGLLAIGGACGDFVGANMIAGTVLVFGPCGNRPAANMRRGTVGLLAATPEPPRLVPEELRVQPPFLRLMFRHLQSLGFAVPSECEDANYRHVSRRPRERRSRRDTHSGA